MKKTHVPPSSRSKSGHGTERSSFEDAEGSYRTEESRFEYSALKSENNFRLFELESGKYDQDLQATLHEYDLEFDGYPSYTALSYTWEKDSSANIQRGSDSDEVHLDDSFPRNSPPSGPWIWLDKKGVKISVNLEGALQVLRHGQRSRYLWVDQICINQEDHEEKSAQILLMPKIYHRASEVNMFVDESLRNDYATIDLCLRLSEAERLVRAGRKSYANRADLKSSTFIRDMGLSAFPSQPWRALVKLFDARVFKRLWIVQEVATASFSARITTSEATRLTLDDVMDASLWIDRCHWTTPITQTYNLGPRLLRSVRALMTLSNVRIAWQHQDPAIRRLLVEKTRNFDVTEPRDKVFALYGLLNDTAHRDVYDVTHGGDFVVDELVKLGFDVHRTKRGGITNVKEEELDRNRPLTDDDLKYQRALNNLMAAEDAKSMELKTKALALLMMIVDSLTDITERWCCGKKPKIQLVKFGKRVSEPFQAWHHIDELLKKVETAVRERSEDVGEDEAQWYLTYLLDRLKPYIKLIEDSDNGQFMDEEDRGDAHEGARQSALTITDMIGGMGLSNEDWDSIISPKCDGGNLQEGYGRIMAKKAAADTRIRGEENEEELRAGEDSNNSEESLEYKGQSTAETQNQHVEEAQSLSTGESATDQFIVTPSSSHESQYENSDSFTSSIREGQSTSHQNRAFQEPLRAHEIDSLQKRQTRSASRKSPWQPWSSKASNLTKPDYRMSVHSIFREFTVHCIEADGTLDILSQIEFAGMEQWCSWVPNFSDGSAPQSKTMVPYAFGELDCLYNASGLANSTSDGPTSCFLWNPQQPHTLQVEGKYVDTISYRDKHGSYPPFDALPAILDETGVAWGDGPYPLRPSENVSEALWRTLIGNFVRTKLGKREYPASWQSAARNVNALPHGYRSYPAPRSFGENFEAFRQVTEMLWIMAEEIEPDDFDSMEEPIAEYQLCEDDVTHQFMSEHVEDAERNGIDVDRWPETVAQTKAFIEAMKHGFLGRMFFVTEQGYYGLGPPDVEIGDKVYVLKGGKVPFVLNKSYVEMFKKEDGPGNFILMGDCYLHGAMDGEIAEDETRPWEKVNLV